MRLYQYLVGENRGKVVALKEIDDVSRPDMTLYVFDDGFKCNSELIADVGDAKAVENHMVLAAVESRQNVWKFKESKVEESHNIGRYKGEEFEIPDPYFVNKDGKRDHEPKTAITPIPPKRPKAELEPLDLYFKSAKKVASVQPIQPVQKTPEESTGDEAVWTPLPVEQPSEHVNISVMGKFNYDRKARAIKVVDPKDTWFDDKVLSVPVDGKEEPETYNMRDVLDVGLKAVAEMYAEEEITEGIAMGPSVMLNNCKKEPAEVSMSLNLLLPSVDAYKLIKENYPEEWAEDFIDGIILKLSYKEIRESLTAGLTEMYEAALQKGKEAPEEP